MASLTAFIVAAICAHRLLLARAGRWLVLGMLIGGAVASTCAWFLNHRLAEVLRAESTARAIDHVQMGVLGRVVASDFVPPHSPDRLADLDSRLSPVLSFRGIQRVGVEAIDLVAPDGVVIYSHRPRQTGRPIPNDRLPLLSAALSGNVASKINLAADDDREPGDESDRLLEVYVPVAVDGTVVGAYEVDVNLPDWPRKQVLPLTGVGGLAGILAFLVRLRLASVRSFPAAGPPPATPETAQPALPTSGEALALYGLSHRELDVLRLLAEGQPYRTIAEKLVISDETVRSHVKRILRKTGQPNRTAAVTAALRAGIIQLSANPAPHPQLPQQLAQPAFTLEGDAVQGRFTPAEGGAQATFTLAGAGVTEQMQLLSAVPRGKRGAPRRH